MADYFHIERLELLVTKTCNSRCMHCSAISPEINTASSFLDMEKLRFSIKKIMDLFTISSIMTYGGEPLLFPDVTIELHQIFKKYGVAKRELITNGFFNLNNNDIFKIVTSLIEAGVNQIFLSVDAFHQEHIPIKYVETFIENVLSTGFRNILLHPAWLVDKENSNDFNIKTCHIIDKLKMKFNISVSNGNIIIPAGYSRNLLGDYYKNINFDISKSCGEIPYTNSLVNIKNLRFLPNGNINICRGVCIGNIFEDRIEDIINGYSPYEEPITQMLLTGGVGNLVEHLKQIGGTIDPKEYFGICDLCADCIKMIKRFKITGDVYLNKGG